MLDNNPVLKDRLHALGVFSGIAIAAVAGFDLVITGGFDFITPGQEIRQIAPSQYVQVVDTPWQSSLTLLPLSSREPLFAQGDTSVIEARLVGGWEDARAPEGAASDLPSEDELYRQIEALYARQDAYEVHQTDYTPSGGGADAYFEENDQREAAKAQPEAEFEQRSDTGDFIEASPNEGDLELRDLSAYESALPS